MNSIKERINQASIVDKFIYLNLIVFVIAFTLKSFAYLNNSTSSFVINYFALSKDASQYMFKIYTFISYGFLHVDFIHLLFNLVAMYYLGNLFLQFFSAIKFIQYYLLGSIFGGIFFVVSYQYFPVFKNSPGVLLGASAGISALLVGLATKMPNYEINLRFIGYVKLWILTLVYIVLTIMLIPSGGNAGGQISHLGGAAIGYILTAYFSNSTIGFNLKKTYKSKSNLKMVYKAKEKSSDFGLSMHQKKIRKQRKIDAILDKISKSGYNSLNKEEQNFLENANRDS